MKPKKSLSIELEKMYILTSYKPRYHITEHNSLSDEKNSTFLVEFMLSESIVSKVSDVV